MLTPAMLRRLLLALIALSLVRVFAVESPAMTNTDAKGVDNGHQHLFGIHRRVGRHARGWTCAIEHVMRFHASAFTQSRKRA
jgi:hypothetical protein